MGLFEEDGRRPEKALKDEGMSTGDKPVRDEGQVDTSTPVEEILARHTVMRALWVGPIIVVVFAIIGGWQGAWSAALGIAVVVANFWLSGWILSNSARISLSAYHAAALIGFILRLGLFVGSVYLIATLVDVDRMAFGISAVVAYLTLLVLEAMAVAKGKERDLNWTS